MCECVCSPSSGSTPTHPRTYPIVSSPANAPYGTFPLSASARSTSRGKGSGPAHVAFMTRRMRSASSSSASGRSSTPAATAPSNARPQGARSPPTGASHPPGTDTGGGTLGQTRRARDERGPCAERVLARLPARRGRQLLPLVLVQILPAPTFGEGHHRRPDRRDERDLHQLAEEAALLRLLSSFGHRRLLLAAWAWLDLNQRPHPYQGCALTELSYRPKGRCRGLHPARRQAYAWLRKGVNRAREQRDLSTRSRYRRSDSVTSMPPTTSESRLYRNTTQTLIAVHSTTSTSPIDRPRVNSHPPWISKDRSANRTRIRRVRESSAPIAPKIAYRIIIAPMITTITHR